MNKKILIFGYHDINRDPRSLRQVKWLSDKFTVDYVCNIPNPHLNATFVKLNADNSFILSKIRMLYLLCGMYKFYLWTKQNRLVLENLKMREYDLIIVHHIKLLPIVEKLQTRGKVILDAHEYYTEVYSESFVWRTFMKSYYWWLSVNYLKVCDLIIAVNQSMAVRYEKDFGIKSDYITNAVDYEDFFPRPVDYKHIKLIHHGLASPSRKIELMIEMMKHTDKRFTLDLVIVEISKFSRIYVNKLKRLAASDERIRFLQPVPMKEVVRFGNAYDIGLFMMPPTNYNEEYSLANKVFQFVQSRLMLAFSPLPEMKKVVLENNLGVVSPDFNPKSLAEELNKLSAKEVYEFKKRSHEMAWKLSSESNRIKFLDIVTDILK
jgi:hypothetical protein